MPLVSAVIRVRNGSQDLRQCLCCLRKQVLPESTELEVVIVDNDSEDDSRKVAEEYGAAIESISKLEFSWGRALNRGISLARGEIVVFLSADAHPVNSEWLSELLKPFGDLRVAAVYGRQEPRSDAPIDEVVRLNRTFGEVRVKFESGAAEYSPTGKGFLASNACGAIRRKLWETLPYDELIQGGEEQVWTYRILEQGHSVVYQPSAKVYHSHLDSPLRFAFREWEIHEKNLALRNKPNGLYAASRFIAGLAKRRIRNCFSPGIPVPIKLRALLILPLELTAASTVVVCSRNQRSRAWLRTLAWR